MIVKRRSEHEKVYETLPMAMFLKGRGKQKNRKNIEKGVRQNDAKINRIQQKILQNLNQTNYPQNAPNIDPKWTPGEPQRSPGTP